MIITKKQKKALIDNYIKENNRDVGECMGFIDGMNAVLKLISKKEKKRRINERKELQNKITELDKILKRLK